MAQHLPAAAAALVACLLLLPAALAQTTVSLHVSNGDLQLLVHAWEDGSHLRAMDAERRVPTASFRRRALTPPPESLVLVASPPSQTILPGECRALTKDFNSFNFDYKANFASTGNLTEGCTFE